MSELKKPIGRRFKCTFYKAAPNGGRKAHQDETAGCLKVLPPLFYIFNHVKIYKLRKEGIFVNEVITLSECEHSYFLLEKDKERNAYVFYCRKCLDLKAKSNSYTLS